jgi:hypothetical protein
MNTTPAFPYGFIVAGHETELQRIVEIDQSGAVKRSFRCDDLPLDVDLRSDGHLLLTTRKAVIALDAGWREVWRYTIDDVFITACQWLPDGDVLVADTLRAQVYTLGREGQTRRALDFPRTPDLSPQYNLFRNVRQIGDGRLLIACHHDRKIAEYDWTRGLVWHAPVDGTPYQAIRMSNGNTLASLGPSGRIVEIDRSGFVVARYDMTLDHGLELGWIAGLTMQPEGVVTYSDSKHDRLVAFEWSTKAMRGIFQDRDKVKHPSSHIILR